MDSLESACLVIADVSGYTSYLTGVELDHAQDILADLMTTVVGALRPPFRLSKLEGDAAFVYAAAGKVDGSLMLDAVDTTYFTFRRRLRNIKQANRCTCKACTAIPTLDLKFVVHHGPIAIQRIAGRQELAGRDVILVHRLLKNDVAARFSDRAYALITDACVKAMGLDAVGLRLLSHSESVDHIGAVNCWIHDVEAAWRLEDETSALEVTAKSALIVRSFETPAPRQLVWELLTVPGHQPKWSAGTDIVVEQTLNGKRGPGTVNHCMHGDQAIIQEILAWRPPDYLTTRSSMPMPGSPKVIMTDRLFELPDGGTRAETRVAKPNARERDKFLAIQPMLIEMIEQSGAALAKLATTVAQQRQVGQTEEPEVPVSARRFISEPVINEPR
jgi:uncharacterized protein YndB with AHSA1/START domain